MTAVPLQADPQSNVTPGDKSVLRLVPKTGGIAPAEQADGRDSYAVTAVADIIDRSLHATIARFTLGLSPAALVQGLFRLGDPSRRVAGQTAATGRQGNAQIDPFRQLRVPLGVERRQDIVLHRAAAAGPTLRRRGLAEAAV